MSYSFNIKAATAEGAKAKVAEALSKVVESQPVHAADQEAAQAVADAFIDLLADDSSMDVQVDMHGSVGWVGSQENPAFTHSNVSVTAYHVKREAQPAA